MLPLIVLTWTAEDKGEDDGLSDWRARRLRRRIGAYGGEP